MQCAIALSCLLGITGAQFSCAGGGSKQEDTTKTIAPSITTPLADQTVTEGQAASFTVVAAGTAPLSYQWKKGTTVVGGNTATLSIASAQISDAGDYTVTVSNASGKTATSTAKLTVNPVATYAITVTAGANGSITPGTTSVAQGGSETFAITPAAGYVVEDVLVDGVSQGAITTYAFNNVTSTHTLSATFKVSQVATYAITVTAGANGSITPGTTSVAQGGSQTFSITPAAGYVVEDVLVDGVSHGAITTYAFNNVTSAHTLSATFKVSPVATYAITVTAGANGSITPGTTSVAQGGSQVFAITPAAGYAVEDVKVDGVSVGALTAYSFTNVTAVHTLSATFKALAVSGNLALNKTATASSAAQPASNAVDGKGVNGTRWESIQKVDPQWITVDLGSQMSFNRVVLNWEAACASDYQILVSDDNSTWTPIYTETGGKGGIETINFNTVSARYVQVNGTKRNLDYGYSLWEFEVYSIPTYAITATAGSNGSITPSGSSTIGQGSNATYAITPSAGYMVQDVLVDGISVGAVSSYTFTNVTAAHTIAASFTPLPSFTITASAGANGSISPAGATSLVQGSNQTYSITAANGYTVADVKVDGISVGAVTSYTFTNVKSVHTISATFAVPAQFTITASVDGDGTITPSGAVTVLQGSEQTFAITPNTGFIVSKVEVDGVSVGSKKSYTFSNIQGAHTIKAIFAAAGNTLWNEEFDGPEIDTTKWAFDIGTGANNDGWGNGEWEYYTSSKDNAAIENGMLVITAKNENFGGKPFTSSRLVTRGKYSFNHGRIVARIKMPKGNMIWPAFWLLGDHSEGWPKSGELDIAEMFCGAVGQGDNAVFSTAHWFHDDPAPGGYANYGKTAIYTAPLADDFHEYELLWDSEFVYGKMDGVEHWKMGITDPSLSELKDHFFYLILNVAIGQPQWKMKAASEVDGPMPQKMYVDWIRVYQTDDASAVVLDKAAMQPSGNFGIIADGTTCPSSLTIDSDSHLYLWNNLTTTTGTPQAGASSLALKTNDTTWFGFGVASTTRRNLMKYAAGYLNVSMKTTSTVPFKVGLSGGAGGEGWVSFTSGSDPYGFKRDGQWHSVAIPMNKFGGVDFSDIIQYFMVVSDGAVVANNTFEFDEIYFSEGDGQNVIKPVGTKFGLYTDATCDAGKFEPGTNGEIYVWNTGNNQVNAPVPFEGANSFSFSVPKAEWYGLGFTPNKFYDLSAFANGKLHIALKVPATTTTTFKIGLKSPGGTGIRESWIKFVNGSDPYGFKRDGQYHELVIPAADFCNSDFSAIAQLLMISGDGTATMEFDDVYWTAN